MPNYLFQLGNTPELSLREIQAFVPSSDIGSVNKDMLPVELESDERAKELMNILGGTVKILRVEKMLTPDELNDLSTVIVEYLTSQENDKVTFGVMEWGRDHLPMLSVPEIKDALIAAGKRVRYHEGSRHGLSASVLLHHSAVVEVAIVQSAIGSCLCRTVGVQDIDLWSLRDRGKPYFDKRKGMLPPKVARMMVNIAVGDGFSKALVYDPFCGTGTILLEALVLGCQVAGSDTDPTSIKGTKQNVAWYLDAMRLELPQEPAIFVADAANASVRDLGRTVTHIVTEPFLGKVTPLPHQLPNIFKGLSKMYLGAFKNWTQILADGAKVVIIFPVVQTPKTDFTLESLIDKLAELGYTMESEPVMYSRPQAIVQRQIHTFRFRK